MDTLNTETYQYVNHVPQNDPICYTRYTTGNLTNEEMSKQESKERARERERRRLLLTMDEFLSPATYPIPMFPPDCGQKWSGIVRDQKKPSVSRQQYTEGSQYTGC